MDIAVRAATERFQQRKVAADPVAGDADRRRAPGCAERGHLEPIPYDERGPTCRIGLAHAATEGIVAVRHRAAGTGRRSQLADAIELEAPVVDGADALR